MTTKQKKTKVGMVLAPGASATRDHSALRSIEEAVTPIGVSVERIDLPRGKAERAIGTMERAANALAAEVGTVFLGGRSVGGRVASLTVAQGLVDAAAGLVLISYPLHSPGKRDQSRAQHFPSINVPCLFVSGTRDSFGTPDELERAAKTIAGDVDHVWIEGGDHGLRGKDAAVAGAVADWVVRRLPVARS